MEESVEVQIQTATEPSNQTPEVTKNKKKKMPKQDVIFILAMLAIPVVHFGFFWISTNVGSLALAFTMGGKFSMHWFDMVWFALKTGQDNFGEALLNTGIFFVKDLCMIPFHLLVSYFLYRQVKGYSVFRIIFYMPAIISPVAIASMFSLFVGPTGPLNHLLVNELQWVSKSVGFLSDRRYANMVIMFYTLWLGWGGNMLLLGGALARVPVEILESGRLDGIGTWREIIYLIFPLVWPTMSTLIILGLTGLFSAGGPVMLLTGGNYGTTNLTYWIFCKSGGNDPSAAQYNYVSAAGLFLTAIGVPIILVCRKLIEMIPTVEY